MPSYRNGFQELTNLQKIYCKNNAAFYIKNFYNEDHNTTKKHEWYELL